MVEKAKIFDCFALIDWCQFVKNNNFLVNRERQKSEIAILAWLLCEINSYAYQNWHVLLSSKIKISHYVIINRCIINHFVDCWLTFVKLSSCQFSSGAKTPVQTGTTLLWTYKTYFIRKFIFHIRKFSRRQNLSRDKIASALIWRFFVANNFGWIKNLNGWIFLDVLKIIFLVKRHNINRLVLVELNHAYT